MRKFSALSSSLFAEAVSVLQKDVDKLEESMKMTKNIDEKIEKLEKTMDLDQNSLEVREGNVENRVENLTNLITNMDGEEHPGEIYIISNRAGFLSGFPIHRKNFPIQGIFAKCSGSLFRKFSKNVRDPENPKNPDNFPKWIAGIAHPKAASDFKVFEFSGLQFYSLSNLCYDYNHQLCFTQVFLHNKPLHSFSCTIPKVRETRAASFLISVLWRNYL